MGESGYEAAPDLCENFKMPQMSMHRKIQFCLAFWVFRALLGDGEGHLMLRALGLG